MHVLNNHFLVILTTFRFFLTLILAGVTCVIDGILSHRILKKKKKNILLGIMFTVRFVSTSGKLAEDWQPGWWVEVGGWADSLCDLWYIARSRG